MKKIKNLKYSLGKPHPKRTFIFYFGYHSLFCGLASSLVTRMTNSSIVGWGLFIILEFLLFLLIVPTIYSSYVYWGISETHFYYVDDQIPYSEKLIFLLQRFSRPKPPIPAFEIPLDKINELKLYSRCLNSYIGLYAFPIYFTLNLSDGSQFDGACLFSDDYIISQIFEEIIKKGAFLEDPEGLLDLLKDPKTPANQALEQRFRRKRGNLK